MGGPEATLTGYAKRRDMLVHGQDPFNAEPPRTALARAPLTPLDAFYVRGHGPVPEIGEAQWRLEVTGQVTHSRSLTLEDLRGDRFPQTEVVATLQCAGNRRTGLLEVRDVPGEAPWGPGATGTARWRGVRLADVLAHAGVGPQARHVAFVGADRSEDADPPQLYGGSIPLRKALSGEVLLAHEMNGENLVPVHGGPVRVVVPGYIGARSVKWVQRLELRAEPWDGFYQATAYRLLAPEEEMGRGRGMELGEVALNSDFLSPEDRSTVPAGPVEVSGYAFAGGRREVTRVDISIDGGQTWIQAPLLEDQGKWAWRLWRASVDLEPGAHEVIARAWDSAANTQPERPESLWNPKGYVNNSWARLWVNVR
jgi:sulfite oxidase